MTPAVGQGWKRQDGTLSDRGPGTREPHTAGRDGLLKGSGTRRRGSAELPVHLGPATHVLSQPLQLVGPGVSLHVHSTFRWYLLPGV